MGGSKLQRREALILISMEVYSVQVEYSGQRPSDDWKGHTLWATLEGAKRGLKGERNGILQEKTWLNNENCIETDEEDHFCVRDDEESYEITIIKEKVHE